MRRKSVVVQKDMQEITALDAVSDDDLLHRLSRLVGQSRRVEADLVAHIAEVDRRRLYAREASSSMFVYCTEVLHLSEPEAYLRIAVARASRRYPILLAMLRDGRLHLSAIVRLAPHLDGLDDAGRSQFLERATHRSKRQIQEVVAHLLGLPEPPKSDAADALAVAICAAHRGRLADLGVRRRSTRRSSARAIWAAKGVR
jgi:hypothetical protein